MEGDRVTFELHPDLAVLPLLDLRADFLKTLSTCLSVMMPLIGWASKVLRCLWFTELAPVVESPNKVAEGCSTFIDPGQLPPPSGPSFPRRRESSGSVEPFRVPACAEMTLSVGGEMADTDCRDTAPVVTQPCRA